MTAGRGSGKLTAERVAGHLLDGLRRDRTTLDIGRVRLLRAMHRLSPALAARVLRDS